GVDGVLDVVGEALDDGLAPGASGDFVGGGVHHFAVGADGERIGAGREPGANLGEDVGLGAVFGGEGGAGAVGALSGGGGVATALKHGALVVTHAVLGGLVGAGAVVRGDELVLCPERAGRVVGGKLRGRGGGGGVDGGLKGAAVGFVFTGGIGVVDESAVDEIGEGNEGAAMADLGNDVAGELGDFGFVEGSISSPSVVGVVVAIGSDEARKRGFKFRRGGGGFRGLRIIGQLIATSENGAPRLF